MGMMNSFLLSASASEYGAGTIWMLIMILQGICFSGGIARFIFCMIQITLDDEDAAQNKKRARHAVLFIVYGTLALQLANAITIYFGGPVLAE